MFFFQMVDSSYTVLMIAWCAVATMAGTSMFFGALSSKEVEHLVELLIKYISMKAIVVRMVFVPQGVQLAHWLPWLAVIGQMKMFVGMSKARLASLSAAPAAGLPQHKSVICLLSAIVGISLFGSGSIVLGMPLQQLGWAVCLLFGLDLGIIAVDATKAALSYAALMLDEHDQSSGAAKCQPTLHSRVVTIYQHWRGQEKEAFLYNMHLTADLTGQVLMLAHHVLVWKLHGLSLRFWDILLLLNTYAVVLQTVQRLQLHMKHKTAQRQVDDAFPDASEERLAAEQADCVICRDVLTTTAKQLPCGHVFHSGCLRAWLQQSGSKDFSCPMCRMPLPVLATTEAGSASSSVDSGAELQHVQLRPQWVHHAARDEVAGFAGALDTATFAHGPTAAQSLSQVQPQMHLQDSTHIDAMQIGGAMQAADSKVCIEEHDVGAPELAAPFLNNSSSCCNTHKKLSRDDTSADICMQNCSCSHHEISSSAAATAEEHCSSCDSCLVLKKRQKGRKMLSDNCCPQTCVVGEASNTTDIISTQHQQQQISLTGMPVACCSALAAAMPASEDQQTGLTESVLQCTGMSSLLGVSNGRISIASVEEELQNQAAEQLYSRQHGDLLADPDTADDCRCL